MSTPSQAALSRSRRVLPTLPPTSILIRISITVAYHRSLPEEAPHFCPRGQPSPLVASSHPTSAPPGGSSQRRVPLLDHQRPVTSLPEPKRGGHIAFVGVHREHKGYRCVSSRLARVTRCVGRSSPLPRCRPPSSLPLLLCTTAVDSSSRPFTNQVAATASSLLGSVDPPNLGVSVDHLPQKKTLCLRRS